MLKKYALTITAVIGMIFLTYMITSIQVPYVYAKRQVSSLFDRGPGSLPIPSILSSPGGGPSIITPNNPASSNNISPNAAGGGNNKIPDGSITTSKLADGAVTNPKLASDAVTSDKIKNGEVNTDDIADGAVTSSKASFIKFHTIQSGSDGWNPGAGQANMDIAGPDLNDITESSIIIVNVDDDNHGALAANCGVYDKFVQSSSPFNHGFSIHCDGSPSTAARLDIAVLNPG